MLDRIRLQNFKTHRETEIKLGRLTVLVGPNGAGKSSVLQAIQWAPDQPPAHLTQLARNGETLGRCEIHLDGRFGDGQPWHVHPDENMLPYHRSQLKTELNPALLIPDPSRMAGPVPITSTTPSLSTDGTGLADVIAAMHSDDETAFHALQASLRSVVPQVERISIKRIKVENDIAHALFFDVAGRKGIPATQMSGGTLLALAILALLHSPQRPRILLIDDIDHGLHPKAQWDLLKQLRRLLAQYPDLQIVATSHSPDLVDELDPSEVIVMALRPDGTSAAKPLTACPREDMLGVLRAGQLWSAVGEEWVTLESPLEAELRA